MLKKYLAYKLRKMELQQISWASTIGWYFCASILIGLGIGIGLDKWLGTNPWFTIIFLGYGIAAAFKYLYDGAKSEKW